MEKPLGKHSNHENVCYAKIYVSDLDKHFSVIHNFVWKWQDEIKRLTLIGDYKDGGWAKNTSYRICK